MEKIDLTRVPEHIAIILDGNGRWAKNRMLPRNYGHRKGAFNINKVATYCEEIGVKYLTLYCFSTENWTRPEKEVEYIMEGPIRLFGRLKKQIKNSNTRWKIIGRRDRINKELLDLINELEEETKDKKGLTLTICFDYGSYEEITQAVKKIAKDCVDKKINPEDITPELIENNLYTAGYPKLDLLIRTSGEQRISNFLLWQIAYSEFYFTNVLWPDFDKEELYKAIASYQKRDRRFGGLNDNKKN